MRDTSCVPGGLSLHTLAVSGHRCTSPDEVNSLCGAAEALSGLSGPRSLLQEVMWLRDILKNKALSQAVVMDLS